MAALSLVCQDCGVLLKSVKEAQDHGDATGHANFAESTEAVKRYVCTECGKPCRSDTEREVHTKRTGHTGFKEVASEEVLNTEAQMAAARAEAGGGEGGAAAAGAGSSTDMEVELVAPEVNPELLKELQGMGFGTNRATRALHFSGGEALEAAVNWIMEHESDADIDEPLLVPKGEPKHKLSAEEAKAKAAELVRLAREKREREDKELERLREQERLRSGRELAAAARQEEELRLKRQIEERRREKEEEERAREKIRTKLEQDRRERRRRLGLPEELTEEEKEAERKRLEEKLAEEARRKLPIKPAAAAEKMRALLVEMKRAHPGQDEALRTCWQTLFKFCANVANAPQEEKFQRVRLTNPAVQSRVAAFKGAVDFLQVAGFKPDAGGEFLELGQPDLPLLQVAGEQLNSALTNPFFGAL